MIDRVENKDATFFLQIADYNGIVIRFNGGGKVEAEIVSSLAEKINEKLRFYNRPQKRKEAIAESIREFITELKRQTIKAL